MIVGSTDMLTAKVSRLHASLQHGRRSCGLTGALRWAQTGARRISGRCVRRQTGL